MKPPPKILIWLLDAFCPANRPDLKGDFLELYEYRVEETGRFKANRKFLSDVLSVIPLKFIIKEKLIEANSSGVDHMCRIDFHSEMVTIDSDKQYLESEIIFADSTFFDIFFALCKR